MTVKLFIEAVIKFFAGVLLTGLMIFIPAGTFAYKNGWLLMALLFIPMIIIGITLMIKNPELLKLRLNAKETQHEQKIVLLLSGIMFVAGFIISGLTYRFGWCTIPNCIIYTASVIFLIGYILFAKVLKENTYLSRNIKVKENQKVIDTGLYRFIRHPMYTATLFLFLSIPLILGSFYSFVVFLIYPYIIVKRIENEEKILEKELEGYIEYKKRVKYRLIPFVW